MPFGQSADGGITGQMSYMVHVDGQQKAGQSQAGTGHSRFTAGMAGSHDDGLEYFGWRGLHAPLRLRQKEWMQKSARRQGVKFMDPFSSGWWALCIMRDQTTAW